MLSVLETDTDTMATITLAIVATLDYLNSDIFSDRDANSGGGDLLSVINASENVTTSVYSLMQQTQLIGCVVRTPDQVSTYTGILNIGILDSVGTIGHELAGNIFSFSSNVDIASAPLDSAINIGKAVSSDKSNITAYQNGISATQTMLDIVLIDMLKNGSPGER